MEFNTDVVIVVGFLLLNLAVGLYYGRGVKTIKEYALGSRNFSTGTLVSTIIATWIGGDYLFITLEEVYNTGLHYAIGCLGMAFCLFITGYVFVPRMGEFLGNISVAEAMGNLYGEKARIITAFTGAIAACGFVALQFKVLGDISKSYLGLSSSYATILSGVIIVTYSAFGGIRSITFTDILQFFTFGILIPVLGFIIWNDVSNSENFNLIQIVSDASIFNYKEFLGLNNPKFWSLIFLWLLFATPGFDPALFQRIAIGKSVEQVKKAFTISALILMLILIGMSWISFLLYSSNDNLDSSSLVYYIIENYTGTGLKIFILVGITAMCMSTADSNINSASVILTHDFCYPLNFKFKKELLLSKIFAILLGIFSIILATSKQNMLEMVFMTQSFYSPVVGVPFMLAILGFRSTKQVVYISMTTGFASVVLWRAFFMDTGVDSIIPGMVANLLAFTISHYLLAPAKKRADIDDNECDISLESGKDVKKNGGSLSLIQSIKQFDFIAFCRNNSPKNEMTYTGFGIFATISTICTMYSVSNALGAQYKEELLLFYEIMLIFSISFITYPIWPAIIKRIIVVQIAWNIGIFFLLIFCNIFFVILTEFTHLQFVVFTVNLISAALLTRWQVTIGMVFLGLYAGVSYYKYFTGLDYININLNSTAFILYTLLLSGTAIIILLKPKQEYIEKTEAKVDTLELELTHLDGEVNNLNQQVTDYSQKVSHYSERMSDQQKEIDRLGFTAQKILNNVNHELRLPVGNVMNFSEMLSEGLENYSKSELKELSEEVYKNSTRLSSMILNMLDLATLDVKKVDLQKKPVNLSELVEDRVKTCRRIYLQGKPIDFTMSIDQNILINVDANYIRQTVDNLVINAINFSKKGLVKIIVRKQKQEVMFSIIDQGIGVPPQDIYDVFTPFNMGSNTESKAEGRGVGLALCKSVVEAHGGKIIVESNGSTTFSFVLPFGACDKLQ